MEYQKVRQIKYQIECFKIYQIECQIECQRDREMIFQTECKKKCQIKYRMSEICQPDKMSGKMPDGISEDIAPDNCCRTSTTTIHTQCSLQDLNHDHACPVFAAGPQLLCQKLCQIECQKTCQTECQIGCEKECQKRCQIECQKI